MTGLAFAASLVLVVGVASHAFHSWLRFRGQHVDRELSRAAELAKRMDEADRDLERFRTEVKTFMANARTR